MTKRKPIQCAIEGYRFAVDRRGLAVLLYAVNATLSIAVALPIFYLVRSGLGDTGWGNDLAGQFNLPVVADLWSRVVSSDVDAGRSPAMANLIRFLLLSLPLLYVWKTISAVGVLNAVRDNGLRGFWSGVGRFGGKALALGLPFLLLSILTVIGIVIVMGSFAGTIRAERSVFWILGIAMPLAALVVLALIDLMHDYARIGFVNRGESLITAFGNGVAWPFRNGPSIILYAVWFGACLILLALPYVLDSLLVGGTIVGLALVVVLQQAVFVVRAGATIGWFASESAYFETVGFYDEPLIASNPTLPPEGSPNAPESSAEGRPDADLDTTIIT